MNLYLTRVSWVATGIFGRLQSEDGQELLIKTLEHAYPTATIPARFEPKLPPGVYTCKRGMHQLKNMAEPFETFEVLDVPGHTGILFHCGNVNADSEGCILLGLRADGVMDIEQSRIAFNVFLSYVDGLDFFELTVY